VSQAAKRLDAMRRNPAGDWRIEDVEMVCDAYGFDCAPPKRGSHHTISHPSRASILTVPSRRPIKPVYIKLLVSYIDAVRKSP
jgi:predicted RNA binding protein YcfA (HicA-like mRNA interferase family)